MVCWLTFTGHITISDNVAFTLDSKASDSRLIFTLTCISTGGPATTVTWTRDSDTITEGTETVLDDPVTAQYTHTLTVIVRLGGLYTCTVANDKPSQDSAQLAINVQGRVSAARSGVLYMYIILIEVSPLSSVTVTASGNTVTVMWSISSSGDDVTGYLVHYHHPNYNTTIKKISSLSIHSDTFTEHDASQRVYAVSVQTLSTPSALSGPVTVRGQLESF